VSKIKFFAHVISTCHEFDGESQNLNHSDAHCKHLLPAIFAERDSIDPNDFETTKLVKEQFHLPM